MKSLLHKVSFPLGLVFIDFSWGEAFELVAKDHCWAGFMGSWRSKVVLQEGWGELVGVEGVLGSQVACGESFGCLEVGDLLGGLGHHGRDCGVSCAGSVVDFLA